MSVPFVDAVVAVHDPGRPVERAVASLAADDVRVTVVCHGTDPGPVRERLAALAEHPSVRVVRFDDGIRSPAGPFAHGLGLAEAPYVMIMGSDDFAAPGALAAWAAHARRDDPDVLLAPLQHQSGERLRNPLPRPGRKRRLDAVRDRLYYRTAPLGLIRRELLERHPEVGLTPGLRTGEDLAMSTWLWSFARRIDFDRQLPPYVIGADAGDRVTLAPMMLAETFAPIDDLLSRSWIAALTPAQRGSLGCKLLRINLLGAFTRRTAPERWEGETEAAATMIARVGSFAPDAARDLPRADRGLLDALAPAPGPDAAAAAVAAHARAGRAARLLPRRPVRLLGRESVLRRYLLYRL